MSAMDIVKAACKDYAQERQRSKIISETPWFSSVIPDVSDLTNAVDSTHFLSHLVSCIRSQEDWIFRDQSQEARAIRRGLGWTARNEELAIIDNSVSVTGRTYDDLLQFVCSYRLVDVLVQYERLHSDNRPIPKNPAIPGSAKIKHWKKLEDIRDLLLTAKTLVLQVKTTSQIIPDLPPLPMHIQLLRQVVGVQKQTNGLKVLKNVLLAAFSLAWMSNSAFSLSLKQSNNAGSSIAANWDPDSAILVGAQGISKEELKALKDLFKVSSAAALRLPIHMALTTTPLILLIPISLTGSRDNKMDILSVMRDMGNIRPQGLQLIESLVWTMVLKIARGEAQAPDALEGLMGSIPWDIVEGWGPEDPNRTWFRPASMDLAAENPTNRGMQERLLLSTMNSSGQQPRSPAEQAGPSIDETSSHSLGLESEGISPEDVNMEDRERLSSGDKSNSSGDAMTSADAGTAPGSDEGGSDADMGMEGGERSKTVPGLEDTGDSGGDAMTSADGYAPGPEDERGSRGDVNMEDGESHLESRASALGPGENGDSGGDDMSANATTPPEPEDEEYSCRDGHNNQGDPGADVLMGDAEGSAVGAPGVMTTELNRNDSAGDELQNSVEPIATRSSHRLREAAISASASQPLAAPETEFNQDNKKTSAPSGRGKTPATRQKRTPSRPLGLWEIIDVDALEDRDVIDLDIEEQPPKIETDTPIIAYDGKGIAHTFTPRVHDEDIMHSIHSVVRQLAEDYVDGKPPHTVEGAISVFHILTQEEYDKKSVREIQDILRQQHIVVVDRPQSRVKFDANGLRTLTRLNEPVSVQDQSIRLSEGGNANERVKKGTLRQMLNCSQQADGKVLNALSFPMPGAATTAEAFASDLAAWTQTTGEPGCSSKVERPTGDMRWRLCATSGAWHGYHIDADGSGTFIEVEEGKKLWITSDHSVESRHTLAEIGIFFDHNFSVDEGAPKLWGLEAIVLVPGTRLIMRPDTPHAVITIEHSICYGGHFVAMSCMTDTLLGMTHAFMADSYITNTHHTKSRLLLRRMVIFAHQGLVDQALEEDDPDVEHLPNPAEMDSLMDLISLCIIGVLINVLDFRTYTHRNAGEEMSKFEKEQLAKFDCNGLTLPERQACQYVRGLALRMLQWVDDHYCVKDAEAKTVNGFAFNCLFTFVEALRIYMREAEQQDDVSSAPNCTRVSLDNQLESLFPPNSPQGVLRAQVARGILEIEYILPRTTEYTVAERKKPEKPSSRISLEEAMRLGETAADRRFKEGLKINFSMEGPDSLNEKPSKRRKL